MRKGLFLTDSEKIHEVFTFFGELIGGNNFGRGFLNEIFGFGDIRLERKILGKKFENPIGLGAGFDYDGKMVNSIEGIGFGFESIGSVTYGDYGGNEKPRLGRLIKSRSLFVNKGLKSEGVKRVIERLKDFWNRRREEGNRMRMFVSIAKTNCANTKDDRGGIEDYVNSLKEWEKSGIGDFYELNISCPNAFGGEPFTESRRLEKLLRAVRKLNLKKEIFLKMPIDISLKETEMLCNVALRQGVKGVIFGNLTKNRKADGLYSEEVEKFPEGKGAFSGKPLEKKVEEKIKFVYKRFKGKFVIVSLGGVFTAEDAYRRIRLGADLVQLITGLIYEGPGVVKSIKKGLVKLMERDGFEKIEDIVGVDVR